MSELRDRIFQLPLRLYFAEFTKAVGNCNRHGVVAARVLSERRGSVTNFAV